MNSFLSGTGVALVTPFDALGGIDIPAFERLIEHCILGGVDFFVVMGTTAESPVLSAAEKHRLAREAVRIVSGRKPLVFGWGGNDTSALVEGFSSFDFSGYSALLSVAPYYNKPTQAGMKRHFEVLADASPLPLILYNVPGRTASNLSAETTLALSGHPKIAGIKEASGDLNQITRILMGRPEGFAVLSGDDNLTFALMALGAEGVISVMAQLEPQVFSDMVRHAQAGRVEEARALHFALFEATELLFAEGNPTGVKAGLELKNISSRSVRLPLLEASSDLQKRLGEKLSALA